MDCQRGGGQGQRRGGQGGRACGEPPTATGPNVETQVMNTDKDGYTDWYEDGAS